MTILSGYTTSLPTNVLLGSMVIYIDGIAAYGATQGDPSVSLPREFDNLAFDGKLLPIVGLDRKVDGVPTIEGTFIELTTTKALDLEPGGSSATASTVTTITPGLYGEFLVAANYKENVRAVCRLGGPAAGIVAIEFDWALVLVETLQGSSAGNGAIKLTIQARQAAAAASLGVPLHTIKMADTLQSIVTPDP
jgi:hypothetical protein